MIHCGEETQGRSLYPLWFPCGFSHSTLPLKPRGPFQDSCLKPHLSPLVASKYLRLCLAFCSLLLCHRFGGDSCHLSESLDFLQTSLTLKEQTTTGTASSSPHNWASRTSSQHGSQSSRSQTWLFSFLLNCYNNGTILYPSIMSLRDSQ